MTQIRTKGDRVFSIVVGFFFFLFMLMCMLPFYYLIIVSVSDAAEVQRGNVMWRPIGFTLDYYRQILTRSGIANAFFISTARTVVGTIFAVFFNAMFAYTMTQYKMKFRKFMYRMTVATMYVSAGLIPWFLVMRAYNLNNSFWLYILPGAISALNVILIKTYMETIPPSMEESALIDGAGYFTIFTKIMMPLSIPILATVAIWSAVGQWNSWQDNFFLVSNPALKTIQLFLMEILLEAEALAVMMRTGLGSAEFARSRVMTSFTVQVTMAVIVVIPVMMVYPFMQKYFIKGIMIGAVKG